MSSLLQHYPPLQCVWCGETGWWVGDSSLPARAGWWWGGVCVCVCVCGCVCVWGGGGAMGAHRPPCVGGAIHPSWVLASLVPAAGLACGVCVIISLCVQQCRASRSGRMCQVRTHPASPAPPAAASSPPPLSPPLDPGWAPCPSARGSSRGLCTHCLCASCSDSAPPPPQLPRPLFCSVSLFLPTPPPYP